MHFLGFIKTVSNPLIAAFDLSRLRRSVRVTQQIESAMRTNALFQIIIHKLGSSKTNSYILFRL